MSDTIISTSTSFPDGGRIEETGISSFDYFDAADGFFDTYPLDGFFEAVEGVNASFLRADPGAGFACIPAPPVLL